MSRPHAVDLLLYLNEKKELMATQLRDVHSNYPKMFDLTQELADCGLVGIREERTPRVTYTLTLTPLGKRVAEKLSEIRELIGE